MAAAAVDLPHCRQTHRRKEGGSPSWPLPSHASASKGRRLAKATPPGAGPDNTPQNKLLEFTYGLQTKHAPVRQFPGSCRR